MLRKLIGIGIVACSLCACVFLDMLPPIDHEDEPTPVTMTAPVLVDCSLVGPLADNVIVNGGFEEGETGWALDSQGTGATWQPHPLIGAGSPFQPHSGAMAARLGGYEGSLDRISQSVIIPPDGVLTYWWQINAPRLRSQLTVSLVPLDGFDKIVFVTHTDSDSPPGWQQDCVDLSAYPGWAYTVEFDLHNDNYTMTAFDLDDIVLGH